MSMMIGINNSFVEVFKKWPNTREKKALTLMANIFMKKQARQTFW